MKYMTARYFTSNRPPSALSPYGEVTYINESDLEFSNVVPPTYEPETGFIQVHENAIYRLNSTVLVWGPSGRICTAEFQTNNGPIGKSTASINAAGTATPNAHGTVPLNAGDLIYLTFLTNNGASMSVEFQEITVQWMSPGQRPGCA